MKGIICVVLLLSTWACKKHSMTSSHTVFYTNGNKRETRDYFENNNYADFTYEAFHENGFTFSKGEYKDGKRSGLWQWWYEDGSKMDEATYDSDFFIKERRHWYRNGNLSMVEKITGKCTDDCCDGSITTYFENGQIESVYTLVGGVRTGKVLTYYESGELFSEVTYLNDKKDGNYLEWHKNNTIWVNGTFKADLMDSIWSWYDSLGISTKRQLFDNGEFVKQLE